MKAAIVASALAVLLLASSARAQKPELLVKTGHTGFVFSVSFSPDGRTLASGSWDNTIKFWDVASGQELRSLAGHTDRVWSVAFSPDGRTLASTSGDNTAKLWDVVNGHELHSLAGHNDRLRSVAFRLNGQARAVGTDVRTKTIK